MKVVAFLIVYLPLEEFFLKWLPVPGSIYLVLRQAPDLLVFGLFMFALLARISVGGSFRRIGGSADGLLLLFLAWAAFVTIANSPTNAVDAALNIKAMLRYVLLIYIFLNLSSSSWSAEKLLRLISYVVIVQVIFGFLQFVGGLPVRDFLGARSVEVSLAGVTREFTGTRVAGLNDLMGSMGDNISFAFFLIVGLCLSLFTFSFNSFKYWAAVLVCAILIVLSGSRAAVLTAGLLLVGQQCWLMGVWKSARLSGNVLMIGILGALIVNEFSPLIAGDDHRSLLFVFSSDYLEAAFNQRLGIVSYVLPAIFFDPHNLIGFSPAKDVFVDYVLAQLPAIPAILVAVLPLIIEDVYWVAIYIYYGLIGFGLWLFFLGSIFSRVWSTFKNCCEPVEYRVAGTAVGLMLACVPLNFFNQAFEVRGFSFYLWLVVALAIAAPGGTRSSSPITDTRANSPSS